MQCEDLLKKEMRKQAFFLAIDNVSDSIESIEQARTLLSAGFGHMSDNVESIDEAKTIFSAGSDHESIIIVTARSLDILKLRHLNIDENNCLEMPELNRREAKALFLQHAKCDSEVRNEVDDKIITRCVNRCYFQKLSDRKTYHYHPLALMVLGTQLGANKFDPVKWAAQLKELDTFNQFRSSKHPIFSILRKSFDTLLPKDKMLFMDVALFLPQAGWYNYNVSNWLSMVHGTSVRSVREGVSLFYALI